MNEVSKTEARQRISNALDNHMPPFVVEIAVSQFERAIELENINRENTINYLRKSIDDYVIATRNQRRVTPSMEEYINLSLRRGDAFSILCQIVDK